MGAAVGGDTHKHLYQQAGKPSETPTVTVLAEDGTGEMPVPAASSVQSPLRPQAPLLVYLSCT